MPCPLRSPQLVRRSLALAGVTLALACSRAAPPDPAAEAKPTRALKTVDIEAHGTRFDVPVTWKVQHGDRGYTVSAPGGSEAEGLTLVFQALDARSVDGKPLDALQLKARLLDELKATDAEGRLLRTVTFERDGASGLRMETGFTHQGQRWRKDQLLVNHAGQVLSLSYNGAAERFGRALKVWEGALTSLRFDKPVASP